VQQQQAWAEAVLAATYASRDKRPCRAMRRNTCSPATCVAPQACASPGSAWHAVAGAGFLRIERCEGGKGSVQWLRRCRRAPSVGGCKHYWWGDKGFGWKYRYAPMSSAWKPAQ